ncbi:nuclear egress membrane protein [Psittacid alphaherpesvirus 5]|uniref:Nuclear egress membrane protein n=1 Tax=Psittacid alphaherpesvirus 5 TaxID=2972693 RepID=A0A5P9JR00_9ALPH|nr:nuclear egress membrane protein [Psittacid alphaherpesvirus 5]QFU14571.1 nuclear egress membrane protein [Psittacid alphaherpesvirus 5]
MSSDRIIENATSEDKYTRLLDIINSALVVCGMRAHLMYRRDDVRTAPTGDVITSLSRQDGSAVPVEFILEATASILKIREPWIRVQNTGQAVLIAVRFSRSAGSNDITWKPPTTTILLPVARSLWINLNAVQEMKYFHKIKTTPLAALMFLTCYRTGSDGIIARINFRRSNSEHNVERVSVAVYETVGLLNGKRKIDVGLGNSQVTRTMSIATNSHDDRKSTCLSPAVKISTVSGVFANCCKYIYRRILYLYCLFLLLLFPVVFYIFFLKTKL